MRIDQRGVASGGGGTAVGYMCSRWQFLAQLGDQGRVGNRRECLRFPVSTQFHFLIRPTRYWLVTISPSCRLSKPADMISDFMWGTASARPVTLSFQVQSSLTGTFGGAIRNYASNRSYPFSYSIPVANVWTPVSITIPGDTGGTWVLHGNVGAAQLCFGFGCGSSLTAPAGAWVGSGAVSREWVCQYSRNQRCELLRDRRQAGDRQRSDALQSAVARQVHGRLPAVLLCNWERSHRGVQL